MNSRWRKINKFIAVSGIGKKQTGLGAFLANADLDTRENCEMEMDLVVERDQELNCEQSDLTGEPVKSRFRRFRLTYNKVTPQQIFRMIAYKEGAVTSPTGTPANEVHTLTRVDTVSGGSFGYSFTLEGRTGIVDIPYDATAAQIQALLTNQAKSIGKIIKAGDVVCAGDWTSGITLTYAKRLRNADLPLPTIDNSNITGGGSVAVAQTTAGANKYHTAQRSADGSKPLFSFACGEKNGAIATEKYGDAVVESIDFTIDTNNSNMQMVVVISSNFNPELENSFAVPDCLNLPAVKVIDVRLKMDGNWEHRDLVSHTVSLNDNVPINAAFGFDDIDFNVPPERGDVPTQEKTTSLFGDSTHYLHALALEETSEGNEIEVITHLGNPGNRVNIIAPECKIKPQSKLDDHAGEANQSTINIIGTPYALTGLPVTFEAYLDQTESFLTSD